jgi:tetratricopeptide (TPR) repeat protein
MDRNFDNRGDERDPVDASGDVRNELSGTVFGPSVQARDVYGGLHVHQKTTVISPRQLPPAGLLVDRQVDLAELERARTIHAQPGGSSVVVVSGPAGIGKTSLVVHWAGMIAGDFPDGQLYVDLRGHAPHDTAVSPSEVLGQFLRAMGVNPGQVPVGLAECSALYRSLTSERSMIVVLDDAISAGQVRPLLPGPPHSLTVVTSRWRLAGLLAYGARGIQLDRLEADAALELLVHAVGDQRTAAEPDAARELVRLCARFPLALCIAAARLAVRPRWPMSEMVQALASERGRLAALSVEDDMAVRASLDLSYRALPSAAARLYRLLGLYPGTVFEDRLAAAAAALPVREARRLIEVLTDANLLDDAPGGRYRFHDLIRLHAAEMAESDDDATRSDAIRRMLDWLLHSVVVASRLAAPYLHDLPSEVVYEPAEPKSFADAAEALEWLEQEFPNLHAAVRFALDHGLFLVGWQLVDATWPLFLHRGHHQDRLEFDQLGLRAARQGENLYGQAKMLDRIGLALRDLDRLDDAVEHFRQGLSIWQRLGDRIREASSLRRIGAVAAIRGGYEEAIGRFTQALDVYQALGETRRTALALNDLGGALTETGRAAAAIEHLEQARRLLSGRSDRYNQTRTLILLGRAHARAGDVRAAADQLDRALVTMREIGSRAGEAAALEARGDLAERAGRPDEARDRYREALQILISISTREADRLREHLTRLEAPDDA